MNENAHHPLGASQAHRYFRCPGSVRLCAALEAKGFSKKESAYAAEGTAAHAAAAKLLRKDPSRRARIFEKDMNRDLRKAITNYTECVRDSKLVRKMLSLSPEAVIELIHEEIEARVTLPIPSDSPPVTSTADHIGLWHVGHRGGDSAYILVVTDAKFGAGVPVDAERNEQIRLYLLGAAEKLKIFYDIDYYIGVIHQPRLNSRSWELLTAAELGEFAAEAKGRAEATMAKDAPLVPGDHCRWCLANEASRCPALQEKDQQAITKAWDTLESEEQSGSAPSVRFYDVEALERLSDSELGTYLSALEALVDCRELVFEEAKKRMLAGATIPAWGLFETVTHWKWSDEKAVVELLEGVIPEHKLWTRQIVTPAKAMQLAPAHAAALSALRTREPGKPVVAAATDRRKKWQLGTQKEEDLITAIYE